MRELKFRAWGTNINEYMGIPNKPSDVVNILGELINRGTWIIEQYTGLKDKNGKEIYEGDILREKWYDSDIYRGRDRIGKVEYFCDGFICWFRGSAFVGLGMYPTNHIEVIGNIHENPELLEEK